MLPRNSKISYYTKNVHLNFFSNISVLANSANWTSFFITHPTTFKLLFQCLLENSQNIDVKETKFKEANELHENIIFKLISDYESLLSTTSHSDVVFKIGEKSLNAHKVILSCKYRRSLHLLQNCSIFYKLGLMNKNLQLFHCPTVKPFSTNRGL